MTAVCDKTGLRPIGLGLGLAALILVLYFWTCFGASNAVVPDKALCDTIMLKCSKHLYFFVQ